MKKIKYFLEFIIISLLFFIYKILGLRISSFISGKIFEFFGPLFRSKQIIEENIQRAIPEINLKEIEDIKKDIDNSDFLDLSNFKIVNEAEKIKEHLSFASDLNFGTFFHDVMSKLFSDFSTAYYYLDQKKLIMESIKNFQKLINRRALEETRKADSKAKVLTNITILLLSFRFLIHFCTIFVLSASICSKPKGVLIRKFNPFALGCPAGL